MMLSASWRHNITASFSVSLTGPRGVRDRERSLLARLGPEVAGRACLLCPGISGVNLLGYGECIIYLDAEVAHRALDFGVS